MVVSLGFLYSFSSLFFAEGFFEVASGFLQGSVLGFRFSAFGFRLSASEWVRSLSQSHRSSAFGLRFRFSCIESNPARDSPDHVSPCDGCNRGTAASTRRASPMGYPRQISSRETRWQPCLARFSFLPFLLVVDKIDP